MSATHVQLAALARFQREGARCGGWAPRLNICPPRTVTALLELGLLEPKQADEFVIYRVTVVGHAALARAA